MQTLADMFILLFCLVLEDVMKCGEPEVNAVPKDGEEVAENKHTVSLRDGSKNLFVASNREEIYKGKSLACLTMTWYTT